jgi:dolichyl-phosphate beta-glucosyltransferase
VLAAVGRVIAFTDADLPYRMDAVEVSFATIDAGAADVAYGARDLPTSAMTVRRAARRSLASSSFRLLMGALVSRQVRDTQCGLKAFSRRAAHDIFPRVQTDGFAFDAELILVAHRLGLVAARLPVTLVSEAGSTVSLRRHAPQMLRDVFRARLRHARAAGPKSAAVPPYDVLRRPDIGRDRRRAA